MQKPSLSFSLVLGVPFLARLSTTTSFKVAARYEPELGGYQFFSLFEPNLALEKKLDDYIISYRPDEHYYSRYSPTASPYASLEP